MADTLEDDIRPAPLGEALSERYLAYALSTITQRALPDVRDGLKPVHRRILYAMRDAGYGPDKPPPKSARVVGDVMGQYHPHGDQAIYDTLVRLAQPFVTRYPLIYGQGNFGNVDGDGAAAMRYTESRLTEVALALLDGITEETVDFRETYDGKKSEPVILPGAFPNLLANGTTGIAVGMATSIPPHNAGEICDAALHLVKHPNATIETLMKHVKGPDFPTGGIVVDDPRTVAEAYATGRGGFRVRAVWDTENKNRGTWVIVVTEIPYQVQKSKLIEKIAELIQARKLPLIANVRDESAEDIRIVLEPKSRTVDPVLAMEQLFKLTDLETRVPLNMNVLDGGRVPRVMNLREVLRAFLDHRREVLIRRSEYRLRKARDRLEILDGLLKAFLNLDEVIRIIREEDDPKAEMMKAFKLTDVQAEAILNTRLRSLRKLEEMEIKKEHRELKKTAKDLRALLKSEKLQWQEISAELKGIKEKFGQKTALGKRRTLFGDAPDTEELDLDALVEKEPITVVCSEKGWIRALKGHADPGIELKFKQGDGPRFFIHAETTDKLLLFGTDGKFYTINADRLPGGRGHGEPVRLLIDLGQDEDIVNLFVHDPERKLLVAATSGHGFVVNESEVVAAKRSGKQVLNLKPGAEACVCVPAHGDRVAVIGENRKMIIFPAEEVPEMARGRGVLLQRYRGGVLSDAQVFQWAEGLRWRDPSGRERVVPAKELRDWIGHRAQAGRLPPRGFPRSNKFGL
ncbi:MAG: DNA topoisomerase IV subunit A [Alphaproteobacteria bacterium]